MRAIEGTVPLVGPNAPFQGMTYQALSEGVAYGTLKFGRHPTAYAEAGRKLDPFYNTALTGAGGIADAGSMFRGGNSHGTATAFNADFVGNAISANQYSYQTPAYFGVSGNVAFIVDETGSDGVTRRYFGHSGYQRGHRSALYIAADGCCAFIFAANTATRGGNPSASNLRIAIVDRVFPRFRKGAKK